MAEPPFKDSLGYFMVPQNLEQGGCSYYTYGTPAHGPNNSTIRDGRFKHDNHFHVTIFE